MSREVDGVVLDQWGGILVRWLTPEGTSDSSYTMLEDFNANRGGDAEYILSLHIVELRETIEELRARLFTLEQRTGHTCQDEGCAHFNTPHSHKES